MTITWDPTKRAKALAERGLDFADAAIVIAGVTVVGYVQRDFTRHVFSMRKANDREKERLAPYFEI